MMYVTYKFCVRASNFSRHFVMIDIRKSHRSSEGHGRVRQRSGGTRKGLSGQVCWLLDTCQCRDKGHSGGGCDDTVYDEERTQGNIRCEQDPGLVGVSGHQIDSRECNPITQDAFQFFNERKAFHKTSISHTCRNDGLKHSSNNWRRRFDDKGIAQAMMIPISVLRDSVISTPIRPFQSFCKSSHTCKASRVNYSFEHHKLFRMHSQMTFRDCIRRLHISRCHFKLDDLSQTLRAIEQLVDYNKLSPQEKLVHQRHKEAIEAGEEFYTDPATGCQVTTRLSHLRRGECCGSACRHCPFGHVSVPEEIKRTKVFNSAFYV